MPRGPWNSDICYYCKKLGHWKRGCLQKKLDKWQSHVQGCYANPFSNLAIPGQDPMYYVWMYYGDMWESEC